MDYDYIEPDPDLELDRYSVWDESQGEYVSVMDVSRFKRWWRFMTFDYAYNIHGPLVRLRYDILRHFKRCEWCGKRGCGPYWFSSVCSEKCSRDMYALRVANHKKLHIDARKKNRIGSPVTLCGEWIWMEIKTGMPIMGADNDEFCSTCLKEWR